MPKAAIFDFNGTLFWDSHLQEDSWDEYLEVRGVFLSDEEKNQYVHGRNGKDTFEYIFKTTFSADEISALTEEKEVFYRTACLREEMQLAPGAIKLLTFLRDEGVPMAIATASGRTNVQFFIEKFPLLNFFTLDSIIFDDGNIPGKPNPDLFLKAMDVLAVPPEKTVIFEDSFAGIIAAERAKALEVVVVNSTGKNSYSGRHRIITSFDEFDGRVLLNE